jgi:hypothetical protein
VMTAAAMTAALVAAVVGSGDSVCDGGGNRIKTTINSLGNETI